MALQRYTIPNGKYAVVELNNVAFRRDGRIEAQCALNTTDFGTATHQVCENGSVVTVDNVTRTLRLPKEGDTLMGLVYSAEHMYDERTPALGDFANTVEGFYPRVGYWSRGDKFTTDCIAYDTTDFANDTALRSACAPTALASAPVYAKPCVTTGACQGAWELSDSSSGAVGIVTGRYNTVPNGDFGVQIQIL